MCQTFTELTVCVPLQSRFKDVHEERAPSVLFKNESGFGPHADFVFSVEFDDVDLFCQASDEITRTDWMREIKFQALQSRSRAERPDFGTVGAPASSALDIPDNVS